MTSPRRHRWWPSLPALLAVVALAAIDPAGAASGTDPEPAVDRTPGRLVIDNVDETDGSTAHGGAIELTDLTALVGDTPVAGAGLASLTAATGPFVLCHDASIPGAVVADAIDALDGWAAALDVQGPAIHVQLYWTPLSSASALGAAGPVGFITGPRLPRSDTRYPMALANELLGSDLNGVGCGAAAEIAVYLNSTAGGDGSLWSIGTDTPANDRVDLSMVMMHEVGHGLGVVASASDVGGTMRWPVDGGAPYVFDRSIAVCSTESSAGCTGSLTTLTPSDTADVESGRIWFGAVGAHRLELYAPSIWNAGSSLSHLDESRYPRNSRHGLMTPFLQRGEVFTRVDSALEAVMQSLGWRLQTAPPPPSGVTATRGNGSVTVAFTAPALSTGSPTSAVRVRLWSQGVLVSQADTVASSVTLPGLVNGRRVDVDVRSVNSGGESVSGAVGVSAIPLELPPFATAESAARALWSDVVGVVASDAEVAPMAARLRAGSTVASEASALASDPRVTRRLQVIRLYLGFFERDPDPVGLTYWFDVVRRGVALDVVASSFAIAAEFDTTRSVTNGAFLDAAYRRILGRDPDPDGHRYWVAQLDRGLDRGQVLILFAESAEHVAATQAHADSILLGFSMLGRWPTPIEFAELETMAAAAGRPALAASLATHPEFLARHEVR